jgi:hypothetical protein
MYKLLRVRKILFIHLMQFMSWYLLIAIPLYALSILGETRILSLHNDIKLSSIWSHLISFLCPVIILFVSRTRFYLNPILLFFDKMFNKTIQVNSLRLSKYLL